MILGFYVKRGRKKSRESLVTMIYVKPVRTRTHRSKLKAKGTTMWAGHFYSVGKGNTPPSIKYSQAGPSTHLLNSFPLFLFLPLFVRPPRKNGERPFWISSSFNLLQSYRVQCLLQLLIFFLLLQRRAGACWSGRGSNIASLCIKLNRKFVTFSFL